MVIVKKRTNTGIIFVFINKKKGHNLILVLLNLNIKHQTINLREKKIK